MPSHLVSGPFDPFLYPFPPHGLLLPFFFSALSLPLFLSSHIILTQTTSTQNITDMSSTPVTRTRTQLRAEVQNATAAAEAAVRQPLESSAASGSSAPDTTALLMQLLQQQHLQRRLDNANAQLAAAESLAQQRKSSAGLPPTFNGERNNDELAVNTWLDGMESWFIHAHVDIDANTERIEIAMSALRGSAQQWWAATRAANTVNVAAGAPTALDIWADVVSSLRKHYLPQNPAR